MMNTLCGCELRSYGYEIRAGVPAEASALDNIGQLNHIQAGAGNASNNFFSSTALPTRGPCTRGKSLVKTMPNELAVTLDSPDLPLSDYRSLREGKEVAAPEPTPEAVAETPTAETAVESETTDKPEVAGQEPEKKKGDKLQARFSELTGKIKALEQQLAVKNGIGQPEKPESKPAAVANAPAKPELKNFSDYEVYLEAHAKYLEDRQDYLLDQKEQQRTQAEQQRKLEAESKAVAETWEQRTKAAEAKYDDFAEVALDSKLPVNQAMALAIQDSEIGPEILYYLGKNPDEATRISKLSPVAAVRAIGKIEAALSTEEKTEPQTKTPPVSKAPAPVRPLAGAATTNPVKNVDSMTQSEYRALREAGKIR